MSSISTVYTVAPHQQPPQTTSILRLQGSPAPAAGFGAPMASPVTAGLSFGGPGTAGQFRATPLTGPTHHSSRLVRNVPTPSTPAPGGHYGFFREAPDPASAAQIEEVAQQAAKAAYDANRAGGEAVAQQAARAAYDATKAQGHAAYDAHRHQERQAQYAAAQAAAAAGAGGAGVGAAWAPSYGGPRAPGAPQWDLGAGAHRSSVYSGAFSPEVDPGMLPHAGWVGGPRAPGAPVMGWGASAPHSYSGAFKPNPPRGGKSKRSKNKKTRSRKLSSKASRKNRR